MIMDFKDLERCFLNLTSESRDLFLDGKVPDLECAPSPLQFLRQWVMPNKPVVIRNAFQHWPALAKWDTHYLRSRLAASEVTVAVTPTGYADAVCDGQFMLPEERSMLFPDFLDVLDGHTQNDGVFYVQKQNSNFTEEFDILMKDAEQHVPWATEAFGRLPDAVNFWMGDARAVTSMHKDHYENLYCVIRGRKTFTLIPPTDQPFVPYANYPVARYHETAPGTWDRVPHASQEQVPWVCIDPLEPDLTQFPEFRHARPITVSVEAGEMLYLPSLWFHHVQQTHGCIAVNFWYDMEYDIKYSYFKFTEELLKTSKS